MEPIHINPQQKIRVKASELLSKFKHREDRYNFCREKSKYINIIFIDYYLPQENYFDSTFFLQWLSGTKKVSYMTIIYIVITFGQTWRLFNSIF